MSRSQIDDVLIRLTEDGSPYPHRQLRDGAPLPAQGGLKVDFPLEVGHDPVVGVTLSSSGRGRKTIPD